MAALTYKLMACLLLIQAVTGWCCHRPCPKDGTCAASANQSVAAKSCSHSHCGGERENTPPAPCEHDDCNGCCQYVVSLQIEVDLSQVLLTPYFMLARVPAAELAEDFASSERMTADIGDAYSTPVRLHLLNQILLV